MWSLHDISIPFNAKSITKTTNLRRSLEPGLSASVRVRIGSDAIVSLEHRLQRLKGVVIRSHRSGAE